MMALPGGANAAPSAVAPSQPMDIPGNTPAIAPSLEETYTLGSGDRISVEVFRLDDYSGEHEVLVDGSINLPVVGKVIVGGLTLDQASEAIASKLAQNLRRPIIAVRLVAPRSMQIGVSGEVNRPGSYTVSPTGSQLPTLTQLLELAGGVRVSADLRQVQIRRDVGMGQTQLFTIDLWQLLQTGDMGYDITLRDGDAVFLPASTPFNAAEALQIADASFATDDTEPLNIAVVGEVFRPGSYTVTGTASTTVAGETGVSTGGTTILPTVTRAIQVAGGIKPMADIRQIQVYRRTRSGEQQIIDINLWHLLQEGDLHQDILLQEGDTVFVPTATDLELLDAEATQVAAASFSPDSVSINVVGEVEKPGLVQLPPNTPLNQAILAAGGFDVSRAQTSSVELIRLNPNGTVTRRSIAVDLAAGLNEETNPALRNNDVVIISRSSLASTSDALSAFSAPLQDLFYFVTVPFTFLRLLGDN